ncbi:hypothetical protein [Hydrogenimonas sp.]
MRAPVWLLAGFVAAAAFAVPVDVQAIARKLERLGAWRMPPEPGYALYDPFRRAEPLVKEAKKRLPPPARPRPALAVTAIFDGRAFVGGRWVAPGDRVGPYRVVAVREEGIVVREGRRQLYVPLRKGRQLLQVKDAKR